jgi:hypothetical protein
VLAAVSCCFSVFCSHFVPTFVPIFLAYLGQEEMPSVVLNEAGAQQTEKWRQDITADLYQMTTEEDQVLALQKLEEMTSSTTVQ